jgi:hypothetical protein
MPLPAGHPYAGMANVLHTMVTLNDYIIGPTPLTLFHLLQRRMRSGSRMIDRRQGGS